MTARVLNDRIIVRGNRLLATIRKETPSLFNRKTWVGKALSWCMDNDDFRVRLFRFVDVFPALTDSDALVRHLREYFEGEDTPPLLQWGIERGGKSRAAAFLLARLVSENIYQVSKMFMLGETEREAVAGLSRLRKDGFAATVDILGEASVSEEEAEGYAQKYYSLLRALHAGAAGWSPLGGGTGTLDWGTSPRINVSVKPTALFSEARPVDFEGSVTGILGRLVPLYRKVMEVEGFLCIDMEGQQVKDMTLEVYRRLRSAYRDYPHLGIAMQSYLRATDADLADLIGWARKEGLTISVRLVKGAYWDQEVVRAGQNGWEPPVWLDKRETDAAFERQAALILENADICALACGSHNIRSIAAVMEKALDLRVPAERYEFQVLYGMAEPVRKALRSSVGRVRLYAPCGGMVPGMAYLVRRLLENTSNESFLRQTYAGAGNAGLLLADPAARLPGKRYCHDLRKEAASAPILPFRNEPAADFSRRQVRHAFAAALSGVRERLGRTWPLFIDGSEVATADIAASVNPADPAEVVGNVCLAGAKEVAAAFEAARRAFPGWRDAGAGTRAEVLLRAAAAARQRLYELAAWQVLEIGKQWDQAHADVTEAIDFLEYYARQALRLDAPRRLDNLPGEENVESYEPRGVAVVIAPWNFPLAIACGMASAALVTGNTVLFKPSGLTPVTGALLAGLFREAGVPAGAFNFVPGRSAEIGDLLVDHPGTDLIAFTGSLEVGSRIIERAAKIVPGQRNVKRVVCEMGGKNAVIIDADADLDEAVPLLIASAFGFQGQKCSACSRAIVLDSVYDRLVERLVAALCSKRLGPAEDPAFAIGPLAEEAARRKVCEYIEVGRKEGKLLYLGEAPSGGWYAPAAVFGEIEPHHRLAQEEIFGPLLAVMRVRDFDQALAWANSTRFALTGGVFSRSPANLEKARREFRVGNLYLNRGITGALVARQPFGGARLSGGGTKAGGADYLRHFLDPRVVTENTVRRGFAPAAQSQLPPG